MKSRLFIYILLFIICGYAQAQPKPKLQVKPELSSPISWKTDRVNGKALISLKLHNIAVVKVIHLLAEQGGINIVYDPLVEKRVTLNIEKLTIKDALDTLVMAAGLASHLQHGIYIITQKRKKEIVLRSKIFTLKYANAKNFSELLNKNKAGLLSKTGSVGIDLRTNSLIVRDTYANLKQISKIVSALDRPVKQVLIEAHIVIMDQEELDDLGVKWGVRRYKGRNTISGSLQDLMVNKDKNENLTDKLSVNLGIKDVRASSIALQVASIGKDILLDMELNALQAESKAQIISSPRLMTTNNNLAKIEQGTEVPYQISAENGATAVSFRKAVLSLEVTPQITPDNNLVLQLNVAQDRVGNTVKVGTGEAVTINTQRLGTKVLVANGDTLVLGGISQEQNLSGADIVPGLGRLPLIGKLFRRDYIQTKQQELLIFVTPSIILPIKNDKRRKLSLGI